MSTSAFKSDFRRCEQEVLAALAEPEKLADTLRYLKQVSARWSSVPLDDHQRTFASTIATSIGALARVAISSDQMKQEAFQRFEDSMKMIFSDECMSATASPPPPSDRFPSPSPSLSPIPQDSPPMSTSSASTNPHLRSWFLTHLICPFPSQSDKTSLRKHVSISAANLNGWMANMRRRSGWTRGVEEIGGGSKKRFQESVERVLRGDRSATEREKQTVESIRRYVSGIRKKGTVGEWLNNVAAGNDESDAEEQEPEEPISKPIKKRRTGKTESSITHAEVYQPRSSSSTSPHIGDGLVVPTAPVNASRSPGRHNLPSLPSVIAGFDYPLPALLSPGANRSVSNSSSSTEFSINSAPPENQSYAPQYSTQPYIVVPSYQLAGYPTSPIGMNDIPTMHPHQQHLISSPYVFTGLEQSGQSYIPFNPYLPMEAKPLSQQQQQQQQHQSQSQLNPSTNLAQDGSWSFQSMPQPTQYQQQQQQYQQQQPQVSLHNKRRFEGDGYGNRMGPVKRFKA